MDDLLEHCPDDELPLSLGDSSVKAPPSKSEPKAKRLNGVTREEWLMKASQAMIPWLKAAGAGATPKFRVSVGWPLGGRAKNPAKPHRIGECFCSSCSKDGTHEIFISPELDQGWLVLATLLHELIHAFVGIKAKHGPEFKVVAVKAGLTGKMTATVPGDELQGKLRELSKQLGEYPHASLGVGGERLKPKQGTRMLKVICDECGYTVRTTAKWLEHGLPTCPCGHEMVEANASEDKD